MQARTRFSFIFLFLFLKINIQAKAREYNKVELGGAANYFAYADATLTIDKLSNHKRVFEDAISLLPRLSSIIKEQIEK